MVLLQGTKAVENPKTTQTMNIRSSESSLFFINVDNDFLLGAVCEAGNDGVKAFNIHQLDEVSSIQISSQFPSFWHSVNEKMIVNQFVFITIQ